MPQHPDEEIPAHAEQRIQTFLDCLARLLAKRWLREQRQQEPQSADETEGLDEEQ